MTITIKTEYGSEIAGFDSVDEGVAYLGTLYETGITAELVVSTR